MDDLISRQEAIKKILLCENHDMEHDFEFNEGLIVATNAVEELPTAEPEIIKCKECLMHGVCRFEQGLGLDGYCSQAERRSDE